MEVSRAPSSPGKDAAQQKLTFPAVHGLEASHVMAKETVDRALAALAALARPVDASFLAATARFILDRQS